MPANNATVQVRLTQEQIALIRDLLRCNLDALGELIGYADDDSGDRQPDGWFSMLRSSTLQAISAGVVRDSRRAS